MKIGSENIKLVVGGSCEMGVANSIWSGREKLIKYNVAPTVANHAELCGITLSDRLFS